MKYIIFSIYFGITAFILIACSPKLSNKASNRLLDEFRIDEYRGYTVMGVAKSNSKFRNVSMYNSEKKRYVYVKVPSWLADYWQEGDTIK